MRDPMWDQLKAQWDTTDYDALTARLARDRENRAEPSAAARIVPAKPIEHDGITTDFHPNACKCGEVFPTRYELHRHLCAKKLWTFDDEGTE